MTLAFLPVRTTMEQDRNMIGPMLLEHHSGCFVQNSSCPGEWGSRWEVRAEVGAGDTLESHSTAISRRGGLPPLHQGGNPVDDRTWSDSGSILKMHKIRWGHQDWDTRKDSHGHLTYIGSSPSYVLGDVISNITHPPKPRWHQWQFWRTVQKCGFFWKMKTRVRIKGFPESTEGSHLCCSAVPAGGRAGVPSVSPPALALPGLSGALRAPDGKERLPHAPDNSELHGDRPHLLLCSCLLSDACLCIASPSGVAWVCLWHSSILLLLLLAPSWGKAPKSKRS